MKRLLQMSWICLVLLTAQTNAAPQRNAVTKKLSTDTQNDPNKGADAGTNNVQDPSTNADIAAESDNVQYLNVGNEQSLNSGLNTNLIPDLNSDYLQNVNTDAHASGTHPKAGANTGPDAAVDRKTFATNPGVEKTGKGKSDKVKLQNGNTADANQAETVPVLSETVSGTVETKPISDVSQTGDGIAVNQDTDITNESKERASVNDPNSNQEAVFICIETMAPDAFKAGIIQQTEKTSSPSGYDKLGKVGSKIDTLFQKLFQTFVHSKTGPGSIGKLETSVSLGTSVENTHQMEKVNVAKDPSFEQTAAIDATTNKVGQQESTKDVSNNLDAANMGSDILHDSKQPKRQTHKTKVFTGEEAKRRSKKMFQHLQKFGDQIGYVFKEFFPGIISVKISAGPKSNVRSGISTAKNEKSPAKSELVTNNIHVLGKDKLSNIDTISGNEKGNGPDAVKEKSMKTFDRLEKGIDSIFGGIKPFIDPFMSGRNTNSGGRRKPDNIFDSRFHMKMDNLGQKISSMFKNIFNKSFMKRKDNLFSEPILKGSSIEKTLNSKAKFLDANPEKAPIAEKPVVDSSKPAMKKTPSVAAMMPEGAFGPGLDLPQSGIGPDFNKDMIHSVDATHDPYMKSMNEFQRKFQTIYSNLLQTMMGPFLQSVSKSFTDSLSHIGRDMGISRPIGDTFTDPLSPLVV